MMELKIPAQLYNKYVIYILYLFYAFLCGCVYWGWDAIQDMLYKAGAFSSECDALSPESITIRGMTFIDCSARQEAINNLYTVSFSSHFISSAVFGILLDYSGPKICALVGLGMASAAWIMIGFASSNALYIPGFMLLGMSADPSFLPLLSVANLFPNNASLMMSMLGACRSFSFAQPSLMALAYFQDNSKSNSFWQYCVGYVVLALGLCLVINLLFIPSKPFRPKIDAESNTHKAELQDVSKLSFDDQGLKKKLGIDETKNTEYNRNQTKDPSQTKHDLSDNNYEEETDQISQISKEPTKHSTIVDESQSLLATLLSWEYLLIVPFFCLCLIRGEFYTKNNKQQLVPSGGETTVLDIFRVLNVLSALPGPFFGKLCDSIGCLPVIFILNMIGIYLYVFLLPDVLICKTISVFFFLFYCSFILSNLYVYVAATLPRKRFGTLTGLASAIGGGFCLLSLLFTKISITYLKELKPFNFVPINVLMIAFGFLNIVLWWKMRRVEQLRAKTNKAMAKPLEIVDMESTGRAIEGA